MNIKSLPTIVACAAILLTADRGASQQASDRLNTARTGPDDLLREQESPSQREHSESIDRSRVPRGIGEFFKAELGRKENETIELSEISDALDAFERRNNILVPDRDVLESSTLTTKELVQALDRRVNQKPGGALPPPSTETHIRGKSLARLKPFQRRDLLNNPSQLLNKSDSTPGLTDGAGNKFHDSGSTLNSNRIRAARPNAKDVVGHAILSVKSSIASPLTGSPLAKYRSTNAEISQSDYVTIVREFMKDPKEEEFEALDIAIKRLLAKESTEEYSNGRSRFDKEGREVYPNGQRKFDDAGRPLYANGRPKFDAQGRELHSNGRPKFTRSGSPLYANGQPKRSNTGRTLFPDGDRKNSERGVSLFDNGRRQVTERAGIPVDPKGQSQVRGQDGVRLYENGRPVENAEGERLHRNSNKKETAAGQDLYDNARRMNNVRSEANTYTADRITGSEGFQGRPDGNFPLISVDWASFVRLEGDSVLLRLEKSQEERSFPLADAFIGFAGETVLPADMASINANDRVQIVTQDDWKFLDGQPVGSANEQKLLALFTSNPRHARTVEDGEIAILRLAQARVQQPGSESVEVLLEGAEKSVPLRLEKTLVQRTVGGKTLPVAAPALSPGRTSMVLVSQNTTFQGGQPVKSDPPRAVAIWQDPPSN